MRKRECVECEQEFRPEYPGQVCCKTCSGQLPAITDEVADDDEEEDGSSLDVDVVFSQQLTGETLRVSTEDDKDDDGDEDEESSDKDVSVIAAEQKLAEALQTNSQKLRELSFPEPVVEDEGLVQTVGLHRY